MNKKGGLNFVTLKDKVIFCHVTTMMRDVAHTYFN